MPPLPAANSQHAENHIANDVRVRSEIMRVPVVTDARA